MKTAETVVEHAVTVEIDIPTRSGLYETVSFLAKDLCNYASIGTRGCLYLSLYFPRIVFQLTLHGVKGVFDRCSQVLVRVIRERFPVHDQFAAGHRYVYADLEYLASPVAQLREVDNHTTRHDLVMDTVQFFRALPDTCFNFI
jgi:hypothetical protein